MQLDPRTNASAKLNEAHTQMRSALAVLDQVEGTGYAAAYLDHAIAIVQERLELGAETGKLEIFPGVFDRSSATDTHDKPI